MTPGNRFGDLRISNPIGRMWVLLYWDGEFWRMLPRSFHSRNNLLRDAVANFLYDAIVGDKEFEPWTNSDGATYQNKVRGSTLYTVRLGDSMLVAMGDATCHESPWLEPGKPTIGDPAEPKRD